jgi:hypothetical protein
LQEAEERYRSEQIKKDAKFEDFIDALPDKMTKKEAVKLFAQQNPNDYHRYLDQKELKLLKQTDRTKNDPKFFTEKQKALQRLQQSNNPVFEKDINNQMSKDAAKLFKNLKTVAEKRVATKNLKEYQQLKREGHEEEAKKLADKITKKHKEPEVRLVEGVGETKEEEPEEEKPKRKYNLRTKKEIGKVSSNIITRKEKPVEQDSGFIDDEPVPAPNPEDELTPAEKTKADKKIKKIEETLKDLDHKTTVTTGVMGKIVGLNKTNSKTPVPKVSPLREELKKVYQANGSTYNANSHLGKIYEDLINFNDRNKDNKMRSEYEKETVVHRIIHKRK